jgi:hypothetical protein
MAQADYLTIPIRISFPGVGKPSTGSACVGHTELIANLSRHRPHRMLPYQDAGDREDRGRLRVWVTLGFNNAGAGDLVADAIGAIQAADGIGGRVG